jgi:hypothetical protein
MGEISDFEVIQNVAIGATALWAFASEFSEAAPNGSGPRLPLVMPVLPMVFHRDTLAVIATKNFNGGLFRALSEDRSIAAGLQDRMVDLSDRTFESLGLAYAAGLLTYDHSTQEIVVRRRTLPLSLRDKMDTRVIGAARRLGYWFSTVSVEQVSLLLQIKF